MEENNKFYYDAKQEFKYLETEFGFDLLEKESHWSSYDVNYKKGNIQVRIAFQWYDNLFSIYLTRTDINEKNSNSLSELLNPDNEHNFNFTQLLVDINGVEKDRLLPNGHRDYWDTMKYQARLLKEHGSGYLLGEDWPAFKGQKNQEIEIEVYQYNKGKIKKRLTEKMTTVNQLKEFIKRKKK